MKAKFLVAFAFMALLVAGNAEATSTYATLRYAGVTCLGKGASVACLPSDGSGTYGMAMTKGVLIVMNVNTKQIIFQRIQP